jgi:EAL domain-containing protein (putative c-di-GMP-specific phosphodiesterase class I)
VLDLRHDEMQWATRIEQALDEDRFVFFAQRIEPVGKPRSGLHAEVLIRLIDCDGTLLAPGAFLPAAERYRLATRIDRWVLKRAIAWLKALPPVEIVENLSVNLSGQSVGDPAFQAWALETLCEAGSAVCRTLCLEIIETAAVSGLAVAAGFIAKVRALGLRVALDDFGGGRFVFRPPEERSDRLSQDRRTVHSGPAHRPVERRSGTLLRRRGPGHWREDRGRVC